MNTERNNAKFGRLFDGIRGVRPRVRQADDLGLRGLRLEQKRREVLCGEGVAHTTQHLATVLFNDGSRIFFQGLTEGVVSRQEESAIAASVRDGVASAVG